MSDNVARSAKSAPLCAGVAWRAAGAAVHRCGPGSGPCSLAASSRVVCQMYDSSTDCF